MVAVGILFILISALSVYLVFTKRAKPVELFSFAGISVDYSQMIVNSLGDAVAPSQGGTTMPKTELISPVMVNDTSNLFAHLMLMGFLASIGSKIAAIGVMMVRPVVVKLKAYDQQNLNR